MEIKGEMINIDRFFRITKKKRSTQYYIEFELGNGKSLKPFWDKKEDRDAVYDIIFPPLEDNVAH